MEEHSLCFSVSKLVLNRCGIYAEMHLVEIRISIHTHCQLYNWSLVMVPQWDGTHRSVDTHPFGKGVVDSRCLRNYSMWQELELGNYNMMMDRMFVDIELVELAEYMEAEMMCCMPKGEDSHSAADDRYSDLALRPAVRMVK